MAYYGISNDLTRDNILFRIFLISFLESNKVYRRSRANSNILNNINIFKYKMVCILNNVLPFIIPCNKNVHVRYI